MAVAAAKENDWVRLLALVKENPQSEHLPGVRPMGDDDDVIVVR